MAGLQSFTPKCLNCQTNHQVLYIERYDAYYCYNCQLWAEPPCPNPKCFFCSNRPAHLKTTTPTANPLNPVK